MIPRAEIEELALAGHPPVEIERKLQRRVRRDTIYAVLKEARQRGVPIRRFPRHAGRGGPNSGVSYARIPDDCGEVLRDAARARDCSVKALCEQILRTVAAENLVDAVLDDKPQGDRP